MGILYKSMEVSNDDNAVAQRQLEDQLEEKTNTDCLVKKQEKVHHGANVGAVIMKTRVPGQEGEKGNDAKRYREDSNEAAFLVATVEKIYAHDSLTFDDTVACEVISKWKAILKEDMDVQSDVYVLSNGCKKSSDGNHDYYWEHAPSKGNILGLEIIRDHSRNTLRVSKFRIHNEKLVHTLLKGHSTLSLKDCLSGDCNVEKNGIATGALVKGCSRSEVPAQVKVVAYRRGNNNDHHFTKNEANNLPLRGGHCTYGFTSCDVLNLGALSLNLYPGTLCRLAILCFYPHAHYLESLLTISLNFDLLLDLLAILSLMFFEEVLGFAAALAVLITRASQSRQHESHKLLTAELFDVDYGRISIVTVNTKEYHSDVLANITRIMHRTLVQVVFLMMNNNCILEFVS
ncbi:hypothetical protein Tco_0718378 [Tanacetum coccineum]